MSLKKKKFKPGRILVLLLVVCFASYFALFSASSSFDHTIELAQGDTFASFLKPLSSWDQLRIKLYVKYKAIDMSIIEQGNYVFSGNYSPAAYVAKIQEGVEANYVSYTVLEGRSIYDIDRDLAIKGMIAEGEYVAYVTSQDNIGTLSQKYVFLNKFGAEKLVTLEGFLYPDTYFLDNSHDVIPQLLALQLDNFDKKIRQAMADGFAGYAQRLVREGYEKVSLNYYDLLILATVVEKEERNDVNKPLIAGLFLNRLRAGERIDADITLCYGLKKGYEICTPSLIVNNLTDASNPYNTRAVFGLPPTPIANPSDTSMSAVLNFVTSDYFFYLHDTSGSIHFGKTISEHNANKSKYLN